MRALTRRVLLLASLTSVVLGLFLLGANLAVVPERVTDVVLNLWPVAVLACGVLLLADSLSKRRLTRSLAPTSKRHELPLPAGARVLSCRVQFSYGTLEVGAAADGAHLLTERLGEAPEPTIEAETKAGAGQLSISLGQPLFPSHFQLANTWRLSLPSGLPLELDLRLHETALNLDLRRLQVRALDIHADQGGQRILLGCGQPRLQASIYSSSEDLAIIVPASVWVEVRLLNPFCRVDFPQGDFERSGDGSRVASTAALREASPAAGAPGEGGVIEISIDGALRELLLDVEEASEP